MYSYTAGTFRCNLNNTAWNSGGFESVESAGKVSDIIKCDGFMCGYAGLDPYTDPGACRCIFNLQRNENLLEKNRVEHSREQLRMYNIKRLILRDKQVYFN